MRMPLLQAKEVQAKEDAGGCGCSRDRLGSAPARPGMTRRSFLRTGATAAGGLAALGAALSPLTQLDLSDGSFTLDALLQKHYKEMTKEDIDKALDRIRENVQKRYNVSANIEDVRPMDGVEFGYALSLTRCNGNRACVHACVAENNQSRSPEIQYIRVLEMPKSTMDVEQSDHYFDGDFVPDKDSYYLPVQCHQCAKPPCVKVCPIEATWQEADGITVIDYDWCIGCRYCEAACPYWARRFNFTKPKLASDAQIAENPDIESERLNPNMSYLSNRPRPQGVIEKCTFCLHRTRKGQMPACLEACPTGARKFGNLLDPESEVSQILRTKRVFILKEEVGTLPRFFYYFDERTPRADAGDADHQGSAVPEGATT